MNEALVALIIELHDAMEDARDEGDGEAEEVAAARLAELGDAHPEEAAEGARRFFARLAEQELLPPAAPDLAEDLEAAPPGTDAPESLVARQRRIRDWVNYLGEQRVHPTRRVEPTTLQALRDALAPDGRVRAVGSGHSSSDVARPDAVLVDLRYLNHTLPLGAIPQRPPWLPAGQRLYRVEAGITVAALNERLAADGLALPNMGTYDGQRIIGALSTGTHGTGSRQGPLADLVAAIDVLTVESDGAGAPQLRFVRFESPAGLSNPAVLGQDPSEQGLVLEPDPDLLHAAVVSMGCFGLVYAVTLRVRDAFWLLEERTFERWSVVKADLLERVDAHEFIDVAVNPHRVPGGGAPDWDVLVTVRTEIPEPPGGVALPRNLDQDVLRWIARTVGTKPLGWYVSRHPRFVAKQISRAFARAAQASEDDPFRSKSHHVFRLGYGHDVRAWSNEIGVPLDRAVVAVDRILARAAASAEAGFFHTAPLGVRFTAGSPHWLAPQFERPSCMIEVPLLQGTPGHEPMLRSIQSDLDDLDARPHWGQLHWLALPRVRALYPRAAGWLAAYARFNRFGTFQNAFTRRLGI
jgi:FAD/FMN-containing dehydrogenase